MMGGPYVGNALTFLTSTIIGLYILIVMLRFLFQLVRADFYNPVSQFLVKATNLPLKPMRRVIPGYGGIDLAAVALLLALQLLELWLRYWLQGHSPQVSGLAVLAVAELLSLAKNVFLFSILIQVVLSWVNPGIHNPVTNLLYSLNEPLLAPARRLVPPISGMDLSPIVVLIGLQLLAILPIAILSDIGKGLLV
ncbi:MAG: YggT family protein [Gammaproteobacteria bacterium]|nr:MAG: YggT family protein [Gammaproteobacteria bacterium]